MTVVQTSMFGDEIPAPPQPDKKAEKPLTDRQQFILDFVRHGGQAGVHADEAGAAWCAHRGKHSDDTRCEYDGISGREVLRALRRRGHVKSRRDGTWYALEGVVEPTIAAAPTAEFTRPDGTKGDIPF